MFFSMFSKHTVTSTAAADTSADDNFWQVQKE